MTTSISSEAQKIKDWNMGNKIERIFFEIKNDCIEENITKHVTRVFTSNIFILQHGRQTDGQSKSQTRCSFVQKISHPPQHYGLTDGRREILNYREALQLITKVIIREILSILYAKPKFKISCFRFQSPSRGTPAVSKR